MLVTLCSVGPMDNAPAIRTQTAMTIRGCLSLVDQVMMRRIDECPVVVRRVLCAGRTIILFVAGAEVTPAWRRLRSERPRMSCAGTRAAGAACLSGAAAAGQAGILGRERAARAAPLRPPRHRSAARHAHWQHPPVDVRPGPLTLSLSCRVAGRRRYRFMKL